MENNEIMKLILSEIKGINTRLDEMDTKLNGIDKKIDNHHKQTTQALKIIKVKMDDKFDLTEDYIEAETQRIQKLISR